LFLVSESLFRVHYLLFIVYGLLLADAAHPPINLLPFQIHHAKINSLNPIWDLEPDCRQASFDFLEFISIYFARWEKSE
jgi:hypothetical protein